MTVLQTAAVFEEKKCLLSILTVVLQYSVCSHQRQNDQQQEVPTIMADVTAQIIPPAADAAPKAAEGLAEDLSKK